MKNFYKAIIPKYMDGFKCIGSECSDSCCENWTIHIDEKTYSKYKLINDKELKNNVQRYIVKNKGLVQDSNFASIKLNKDGKCPFLNSKGLCTVQLKKGEGYLSDVCALYPRRANMVNGILEVSLNLSCPEAAKIILDNNSVMEFNYFDEYKFSRQINNLVADAENFNETDYRKYYYDIRNFMIDVIQFRDISLEKRLILLAFFFKDLDNRLKVDKQIDINNIIQDYIIEIKDGSILEKIIEDNDMYNSKLLLLKRISALGSKEGQSPSKEYLQYILECMIGLKYANGIDINIPISIYKDTYKNKYESFMNENSYLMENYLVNYIFGFVMPVGKEKRDNVFEMYTECILNFFLIKTLLVGRIAYGNNLDKDAVIEFMRQMSITLDHHLYYTKDINKFVKDCNLITLENIISMIV